MEACLNNIRGIDGTVCPRSTLKRQSRFSSLSGCSKSFRVLSSANDSDSSNVETQKSAEEHDVYPSGEWPANFSMSNYEDLSQHYAPAVFGEEVISATESSPAQRIETDHGVYPSGEWPANFSMSNYEDLSQHFAPNLFKAEAQPTSLIADVMTRQVVAAKIGSPLSEFSGFFSSYTGLPVVDEELKVVGVISKKDISNPPNGENTPAGILMSSPAITISVDKTILEAAVEMLKNKIHRLPVVNESSQLVGMVTRTDIFTALDGGARSFPDNSAEL